MRFFFLFLHPIFLGNEITAVCVPCTCESMHGAFKQLTARQSLRGITLSCLIESPFSCRLLLLEKRFKQVCRNIEAKNAAKTDSDLLFCTSVLTIFIGWHSSGLSLICQCVENECSELTCRYFIATERRRYFRHSTVSKDTAVSTDYSFGDISRCFTESRSTISMQIPSVFPIIFRSIQSIWSYWMRGIETCTKKAIRQHIVARAGPL